jgi:potassium-dependent mechanosensitive channel
MEQATILMRFRISIAAILMITLCQWTVVHAQIPVPLPTITKQTAAKGDDPAESEDQWADLPAKRAVAEAELKAMSGVGSTAKDAPADLPKEQWGERKTLLQQVVRGYDEQIEDVRRLEKIRRRQEELSREAAQWKGFAEPPPYSIFLADQLWEATYALRLGAEGIQSQLTLTELRFDRTREALQRVEERLRQVSEQLETANDEAQAARQRWLRDTEELRKRAASVQLAASELSKKREEAELAEAQARLAFAERKFQTAAQQTVFTEDDLKKVHIRLSEERESLEAELHQTAADRRVQQQILEKMEQRLEARSTKQPPGTSIDKAGQNMERLRDDLELKRAQVDTRTTEEDLLRQLLDFVGGERQLWDARFAIAHSAEPGQAREAYAKFNPLFNNVAASRDFVRQQVLVVSGQAGEVAHRLRTAAGAEERGRLESLVNNFRQREQAYDRALRRLDHTIRFVERWKAEVKDQHKELPLSDRLVDWSRQAGVGTKTIWNFEVFSAEDTIELDGKQIIGRRSITVGKIISALGILLIGYWICLHLARLIGRLAVTRLGMAADVANLIRQWSQAFLLTILLIISLVSVKIPLTVFAFLGGAFAIGIGFGAQTLLKNVISGILLLIERPLRVGDLIEVENVRGRVTSIGLRSSTVRDAKGMETLIPNSSFLEKHLTNWTYSSRVNRFSLRVGAPYEASTSRVIDMLANLAKEHPHVLEMPPPQVLLEEFGQNARIFTLNYWLEIRLDIDPSQVASELRFAIELKFAEAGLKVLPAA